MENDNKYTFYENILSKIANTLSKYQTYQADPDVDTAVATRKNEQPSGSGYGASLTRNTGYWYDEQMQIDRRRVAKYNDYDMMDTEDPELSSALDIYADNATKGESETDIVIKILSKDQKIVNILNETIDRCHLHTELWSIARELAKDGDCFEEVVAYDDKEVHRLKHLDSSTMVVIHDKWGRPEPNHPYQQKDEQDRVTAKFEAWQIIHFKLTKDRNSKYGVDGSVLFPIRKLYKQLAMIEDSLVLARLTRAIQRYAYLIDTEGIEPGDSTLEYLDKVRNSLKKRRSITPDGKMDLEYNPMSMEEDIFVSTKDGSNANVKVLQGSTNLGVLSDVEYFRNKKFAGVKVPKAYLSHEKDVRARAMITEQDVQFARTVRRLQLALIAGLQKLFDYSLAVRGIDPVVASYEIQLPLLSTIDELRLWQVKQLKHNVCSMLHRDLHVSLHWILINLLEYDEDDVQEIIKYFEDDDSLDNKLLSRDLMKQEMFTTPSDDADSDEADEAPTRKKERPKGGKVPTSKDNQAPTKDRKDKDDETKAENLTKDDITLVKEQLGEDLASLKDIIEWIKELSDE